MKKQLRRFHRTIAWLGVLPRLYALPIILPAIIVCVVTYGLAVATGAGFYSLPMGGLAGAAAFLICALKVDRSLRRRSRATQLFELVPAPVDEGIEIAAAA